MGSTWVFSISQTVSSAASFCRLSSGVATPTGGCMYVQTMSETAKPLASRTVTWSILPFATTV
eukprot:6616346-Prymnesium_polylepis.1